jgi:murein DD-endopeptidase MepM/ murein hydrolase activator NlpD
MKRVAFHILGIALPILLLLPTAVLLAQDPTPTAVASTDDPLIPLVHTVEEGENLTYIAETFGTTVEEILLVNNLSADALLYVGQQLIIPGGSGDAVATIYTAQLGDTLPSIAAAFNTDVDSVMSTNHLLQREAALLPGQSLAIISRTGSALPQAVTGRPHVVAPGESLLMVAARYHINPTELAALNELPSPTYLFPGQRLRIPGETQYRFLPGEWVDVQIRPLPITPGSTIAIYVENLLDGTPSGQFGEQFLHFTPSGDGFVALVGLDAFAEPGLYTLALSGSGSQPWRPMQQQIPVAPGSYTTQYITVGEELSGLLDPQLRVDEDAFLATFYGQFTETQYWDGLFQSPVTSTVITAGYGDGRSYNGGPIEIFHTGVDFGGITGTLILAPAAGKVVFSDVTELRGLVTIIDHGLGVMTAYFHQSESFVAVGEVVTAGQSIGAIGSTGLSSGPHLHWDVRIMNVPVNGGQWLSEDFP